MQGPQQIKIYGNRLIMEVFSSLRSTYLVLKAGADPEYMEGGFKSTKRFVFNILPEFS